MIVRWMGPCSIVDYPNQIFFLNTFVPSYSPTKDEIKLETEKLPAAAYTIYCTITTRGPNPEGRL